MPLPDGAFDGRLAFQDHLRGAMAEAASQNWREIVFSDPDFADWPLGERASIEALQAWAASGRSLVMLARHFKVFERDHARFVRWRQTWSHIIDARACEGAGLPTVFALGVRSLAWGAGGSAEVAVDARPHAAGRALAVACFAVVVAAIALGLTIIIATGQGKIVSFDHIYPTLVDKPK